jgi:hypothetical protein
VERAVASKLGENNFINLELNTADFATASRVVEAINDKYGPGIAYALDSRVIRVQSPSSSDQRVAFIGTLQDMQAILRNSRPSHHECAHRLGGDEPRRHARYLRHFARQSVGVGVGRTAGQPA